MTLEKAKALLESYESQVSYWKKEALMRKENNASAKRVSQAEKSVKVYELDRKSMAKKVRILARAEEDEKPEGDPKVKKTAAKKSLANKAAKKIEKEIEAALSEQSPTDASDHDERASQEG